MTNRILILFAHPLFEKSRIHHALVQSIPKNIGIHFHDLYELYPDFNIDIRKEQKMLLDFDIIVWQHPLYWYSIPPMLKQWIDTVLEFGWAYGKNGDALKGKYLIQIMSSGGKPEAYAHDGRNKHTIQEFMYPHKQTADLCGMHYLPPYVVHGAHQINDLQIHEHARNYADLLEKLSYFDLSLETFDDTMYIETWRDSKSFTQE